MYVDLYIHIYAPLHENYTSPLEKNANGSIVATCMYIDLDHACMQSLTQYNIAVT